jgi:hypothetical protein
MRQIRHPFPHCCLTSPRIASESHRQLDKESRGRRRRHEDLHNISRFREFGVAYRYVSRHSLNWEQNATPLLEKASERPWTASATPRSSWGSAVVVQNDGRHNAHHNIHKYLTNRRYISLQSLHSVANGLFLIAFILKRPRNVLGRPRTSSDGLGRPRTASDGLGRPRQLDVNHRGAPSLCRTIAVTNLATTATKTAQIVSANVTFVAFVETVPYLLHQICRNRPIQRRMRCDQGSLQCGQPMRCPTP